MSGPAWATSPYDAEAALDGQLERLRAQSGATRVSVWVHEASTGMVVPFRQAVAPARRRPPPDRRSAPP